jgi:ubiquinol-cytochrome c reductase subunit 6
VVTAAFVLPFCFHLLTLAILLIQQSEEEIVDALPKIREECVKTCPKPLANYEACKVRIKDKPGVSCEIWYYELHHCVDLCAAPKIFAATKE